MKLDVNDAKTDNGKIRYKCCILEYERSRPYTSLLSRVVKYLSKRA